MSFAQRVKAFGPLFTEASGVRNKAALCGYVASAARSEPENRRHG